MAEEEPEQEGQAISVFVPSGLKEHIVKVCLFLYFIYFLSLIPERHPGNI